MKKQTLILGGALVALLAAGLLFGQSTENTEGEWMQLLVETNNLAYQWEMISENVSAGGSSAFGEYGRVYLYNKLTGKVYRHFSDCGENRPGGCFGALAVLESDDPSVLALPLKRERSQPQ